MRAGLKFQLGGVWIGAHYSPYNRRWCINLIPCVTVWVALRGGKVPHGKGIQAGPVAGYNGVHH
jgi:hypothetical protein